MKTYVLKHIQIATATHEVVPMKQISKVIAMGLQKNIRQKEKKDVSNKDATFEHIK